MADWYVPGIEVFGFDTYPDKMPNLTIAQIAKNIETAVLGSGTDRTIIGEFGVDRSLANAPQIVRDFKAEMGATSLKVEAMAYWSQVGKPGNPDYRLTQATSDAWFIQSAS